MKPARILLVDDEEEILKLLERRLTRLGHQVTTAVEGGQALARLQKAQFDLAILDLTMPEMNGLELAERCRAQHPTLKILMLTGSPVTEEIETARYPFLRKPLEDLQDLDRAIERLLAANGERAGGRGRMMKGRRPVSHQALTEGWLHRPDCPGCRPGGNPGPSGGAGPHPDLHRDAGRRRL